MVAPPKINPGSPLNNDLLAWYLAHPAYFGGTVWPDLSGNGHDGAFFNPSRLTWVGDAATPIAASLNYVSSGLSTGVNIGPVDTSSIRSVVAWIRSSLSGQHHVLGAYSTANPYPGAGFAVGIPGNDGRLSWWNGTWQRSSGMPVPDEWQMVGFTYGVDNSLTFYINGLVAGGGTYNPPSPYTGDAVVGARSDYSYTIAGRISDVRIYNRALSPTEIAAYYAESLGGYKTVLKPTGIPQPLLEGYL